MTSDVSNGKRYSILQNDDDAMTQPLKTQNPKPKPEFKQLFVMKLQSRRSLIFTFTVTPYVKASVKKGNGTANIILIGNSIAYRAYPLFHDILKRRYRIFRLYSRSTCPPLSNRCPDFTEAMKKVVQHEKPDIVWYMHHALFADFVAPVQNLSKDRIYKEFQGNIDFISNYTKHIVIDMPYYKAPFNAGVKLAKRLLFGLPLDKELVVTWQQHINQTRYHRLRLSSLKCSKCIMNEINEDYTKPRGAGKELQKHALYKDGIFCLYDSKTFLVRLGDGLHMTPVGLELLRPLYTKIMDKLLHMLHK